MKKFILIIFLFTFTPIISAQSSSVTVEGNAEISVVPDRASLNLEVELNGQINYSQSVLATFEIEY